MDKKVRDKVVENLYKRASSIYKMNIKLDDSIIDEIVGDKKTIYNIGVEELYIFRNSIGVFSNGEPMKFPCVKSYLDKPVNSSPIKITKQVFSKLNNANLAVLSQKIAFNKNVVNTIPIEEIFWNKSIYDGLHAVGIITLGDLLHKSRDELKVVLGSISCGKVALKIQSLGLHFQSESKEGQVSEQLVLSDLIKRKLMYEKTFQSLDNYMEILIRDIDIINASESKNDVDILKLEQIKEKCLRLNDMKKQFEKEYDILCQQMDNLNSNSNDNFSLSA